MGNKTTAEDLDKWCVALVLYSTVEGRIAFKDNQDIVHNQLNLSYRGSPAYSHFINTMLNKNPLIRLDSNNLKSHPWILGKSSLV